jgi:hypothetical protein
MENQQSIVKHCKECQKEFNPVSVRGVEQLYCTKTCARRAAQKRHEERKRKKIEYELQEKEEKIEKPVNMVNTQQSPEYAESLHRTQRGEDSIRINGRIDSDSNGKDYIHAYYEAKIENNFYKLKCESLEQKVKDLQVEIFNLNSELETLDQEEPEDGGMLGSIVEQFKKDPINSVKFASAIIENLTTPKTAKK